MSVRDNMSDLVILKRQLFRQTVAVFGIPARMVGRVHDPRTALRLVLFAFVIHRHGECLVIGKQHHIRPFFHQRRDLRGCFLAQLELPAIISAHLVRLLKLAHHSVRSKHHIHANGDHLIQRVQQPPELFFFVHIAVAVAEILNAFFTGFVADVRDAQLLCPVDGIDHQRPAYRRVVDHIPHLFH